MSEIHLGNLRLVVLTGLLGSCYKYGESGMIELLY